MSRTLGMPCLRHAVVDAVASLERIDKVSDETVLVSLHEMLQEGDITAAERAAGLREAGRS